MKKLIILLMWASTLIITSVHAKDEITLDTIVASVNDDVITSRELNTRALATKRELKRQNTTLPDEQTLKHHVLKEMIKEQLLLQLAKQNEISATEDEVNNAVEKMADENHMTIARLKNNIRNNGLKYEDFKDDLKKQMIVAKLEQRQLASKIVISDNEVKHYMDSNPINKSIQYRLGHILVSLPENPTTVQIQQAKTKAEKVLGLIKSGTEFQKAAQSIDNDGSLTSTDLGFREVAELPILFARTATGMQKGQISDLIRDASGFHIIKLIDTKKNDNTKINLEASQQKIKELLYRRKFNEAVSRWVQQLYDSASIDLKNDTLT